MYCATFGMSRSGILNGLDAMSHSLLSELLKHNSPVSEESKCTSSHILNIVRRHAVREDVHFYRLISIGNSFDSQEGVQDVLIIQLP